MAVSIALPRPDLAAHREALSLAWPELVTRLTEIIGRKLTAYIAGVKDVRALDRWIKVSHCRFRAPRDIRHPDAHCVSRRRVL
jgi:hypothetical protein